jgi:hypothetical protein
MIARDGKTIAYDEIAIETRTPLASMPRRVVILRRADDQ